MEDILAHKELIELIRTADKYLGVIGYTEHGERHANIVSERAKEVLEQLGQDERTVELARIAGYLHDIGNAVAREHHAQNGALLLYPILKDMGMQLNEIIGIVSAIGNHHEADGDPISAISAAVILADKSDVHFNRVRKSGDVEHDIHDRVNFAAKKSSLTVRRKHGIIELSVLIDHEIASVMEYFEIFMDRMIISRRAANFLGLHFELVINGVRLS